MYSSNIFLQTSAKHVLPMNSQFQGGLWCLVPVAVH